MRAEPPLPDVFTRRETTAAGLSRHQVASRLRSGHWVRLRRGVFCRRETFESYPPNRRHVLHAIATRMAHRQLELVESHLTAAARWELPMPLDEAARAYLTDACLSRSTRLDDRSVVEVASLAPGDVVIRSGVPVTTPARTVADCLRHYPSEVSVPIADAAIHRGLTTLAAVAEVLERQSTWPYAVQGRRSVELVDGRRESWLESLSVVRLTWCGIPAAEPQVEVYDEDGTFIARVDLLWVVKATVGEADGRAKYSLGAWPDLASAGVDELVDARVEAGLRVVRLEKAREDALRTVGLEVVRWDTAEILRRLPDVARRIRAAHARGSLDRFTGHFRQTPQP